MTISHGDLQALYLTTNIEPRTFGFGYDSGKLNTGYWEKTLYIDDFISHSEVGVCRCLVTGILYSQS